MMFISNNYSYKHSQPESNYPNTNHMVNNNIGGIINNVLNSMLSSNSSNESLLNNVSKSFFSLNSNQGVNMFSNGACQSEADLYAADENKCHVCGDKSTGSHFGGISCESCKAFFRRSVQKNRFEDYKCSYSGECKMNTNTRKICQFCRYKKCLGIGMRPKWVLTDDERQQKYGNRRKINKLKGEQGSISSPVRSLTVENEQRIDTARASDTALENTELDILIKHMNKLGIDGIDMKSMHLNKYEEALIDRLSISFYHARKSNSLDLGLQQSLYKNLSRNVSKDALVDLIRLYYVQPVRLISKFAKLIPDFSKLDINDQMCLLQGGTMEIFICSSSSLYDQFSNRFMNIENKERQTQVNDSSNTQLDILRLIWSEGVFEKTINFLKSIYELKFDEATMILFLPLILFSPDRAHLKNRRDVFAIQSKYSHLLKKYLVWKYGSNNVETNKLFNNLLLKLIELRTLHEMHSSILLDANSSQLELHTNNQVNTLSSASIDIGKENFKLINYENSSVGCSLNNSSPLSQIQENTEELRLEKTLSDVSDISMEHDRQDSTEEPISCIPSISTNRKSIDCLSQDATLSSENS